MSFKGSNVYAKKIRDYRTSFSDSIVADVQFCASAKQTRHRAASVF
jgi:hypothetical protein